MAPIYRIALTGGPCGGKSTALARLTDRLSALGFRVFLVPEAAATLFQGGASLLNASQEQLFSFEASLLRMQLAVEESFLSLARGAGQPAVVLFDRGLLDPGAYVPPATWQALLSDLGKTEHELLSRYDAVIHLRTAARGADEFYSPGSNATRSESPDLACAIDQRIQEAYAGHPQHRIIDNSSDFGGKIHRVFEAVCRVTGIPLPIEIERKFILRGFTEPLPVPVEEIYIEQTYLRTTDGSEGRVRRRGQRGAIVHIHTLRKPLVSGQRVLVERPISPREYAALLTQADPSRRTVKKRRVCFLWEGQYFEIDRFLDPCSGLAMLKIELEHHERDVLIPPFLEVEREVTSKPEFSSYTLAHQR